MVIGVHAVAAHRPHPTGVERYVRNLLAAIATLPEAKTHRFFLYSDVAYEDVLLSPAFTVRRLRSPFFWTQARLSWEMIFHPSDVLFCPAQALPRVVPHRGAVATIHGVEFLRVPAAYSAPRRRYLEFFTKDALHRSRAVIVPSHATKRDLVRCYRVSPDSIVVIPHGIPNAFSAPQEPVAVSTERPFFLFLGRIELLKNVDGIVRAFTAMRQQRGAEFPDLVLAGTLGFGGERILQLIRESPVRDAISVRGYISEDEKHALLTHARALLFPSHAEGFGFPILEAQAAGTAVITSTGTATEEVAGNGALLVRSDDERELADAMRMLADDNVLWQTIVSRGKRNLERFSWQNAAAATLSTLLG